MRKQALFLLVIFFSSITVFAAGRKDNESHEADNPAGFTKSLDIGSKANGKWNFYLEAGDKGGNKSIAGPYNIYIDPESDLPRTQIINPGTNMRVQGNLNIVGTCADDDEVGQVELTVTRTGDDKGAPLFEGRAEGKEFWSYLLDTSDTEKWRDGSYTITSWGIDINGLSGISDAFPEKSRKLHQVSWNLDRKKPDITVTSHAPGALLGGKVTLRGTVWDGNGVEYLACSLDGGSRYEPISLKYDTRADIYTFELSIDTVVFEDGPAVIQLKARDRMKTEGALSFLMFVNNTGPDVQILYPEDPKEAVSGVFTVAGYAMHKVGLASLSWKLGKEQGEFDLIKGNPWWVKEFDIRGQNVKSLDLEIRAVDLSGNVTVARRKIPVDQAADEPKVTLSEPAPGALIPDSGMNLVGTAVDNGGVEAIFYSVDGNPPVEIPCSGYFQLSVRDIPAGVHNLEVWARDITGVTGPKVLVKGIVAPGMAPESRITQLRSTVNRNTTTQEFRSGIEIPGGAASTLDILVSSGSALQSLSCQLGSGEPIVLQTRGSKGGDYSQSVPIPGNMSGRVRTVIRAKDIHNRETVMEDYFYINNGETGGIRDFTWVKKPGNTLEDGRILLSSADEVLVGVTDGMLLLAAEANGENAAALRVWVDDYGRLNLSGTEEGSFGPVRFNLTGRDGSRFTTGEYRFLVDTADPVLEIPDNPDGRWVQNRFDLKLRAMDANRIRSLQFSDNLGGSWNRLAGEEDMREPGSLIERTLDISALSDGAVNLSIRITDEAGREALKTFTINKDTRPPEAKLIVPISGARVNGTIRMGIAVTEAGKIASVSYEKPGSGEEDGAEPVSRRIYPNPEKGDMPLNFLDLVMDAAEMPLDNAMRFVFTDAAGNESTLSRWPFVIDQEMDLPTAQISLPLENEVITSDFVISGISYDDDEVRRIYWRLDDGPEQVTETTNGFSVEVPLSMMSDNEHSVTITAEDIFGVKSRSETRNFRVSLAEPTARVTTPDLGEIVGGTVRITGAALDKNGINRIQVSLDNGNSFNDAEGAEEWYYDFNSHILQDGPHVVFVRAWDNYEINATYSSMLAVDNTPPELVLDTPRDGITTTGPVYITGRAVDNLMLDSLSIRVSSLEGGEIPPHLAQRNVKLDPLLLEELDLRALPDGTYNVEVWAEDRSKNLSRLSRNIQLAKDTQRNFVDNLYPLNGEHLQGSFNLYGYVGGIDSAGDVTLIINDRPAWTEPVTEAGYYRFAVNPVNLVPGQNKIVVRSDFGGRETVESTERIISYRPDGPWVTVDTLNMGDFAYERPWLMGRAGYALSGEDQAVLEDKKADKEARALVEAKAPAQIELSFDNGRTFFAARKAGEEGYDWRYRLETQDMAEGLHYLVVRAVMVNGETAVTRLLIQVDKTAPEIRLISPESGGRYNENLEFTALASDDIELKSLGYHLRKGDKAAYEVPGFIKGLYFESTIPPFIRQVWNDAPTIFAGGATYMDIGFGLSFFDDNVKIQAQYGFLTQDLYKSIGGVGPIRYGGHVLGFKILANVYTLPFGVFGGPDWEWLSASFALGANFSLFDVAREGYTQSGNATWMSAMLAQVEFPKITLPKRTYLRTFSLFTEGQLWFVPTDVDADANDIKTVIPHVILGLRIYIF